MAGLGTGVISDSILIKFDKGGRNVDDGDWHNLLRWKLQDTGLHRGRVQRLSVDQGRTRGESRAIPLLLFLVSRSRCRAKSYANSVSFRGGPYVVQE